ncbi:hypothetical protein GGS24DRAFT_510100 [Hypoxylon argillaceum]|nr:hypothetical protein GGS24DRAFT_510100 [Hypoxylon argillaceum]
MCGCQRTTYLCQCRHKERQIERCLIYQLREESTCWASCLPKCRTRVQRFRLQRVCRDCEKYFYGKYGKQHYQKFIQYFLEYKERMGWGKTAIDPRTVPRSALLDRQSAPAQMGSQAEQGAGRGRGQPFQVNQPMLSATGSPTDRNAQRHPAARADKQTAGRNHPSPPYPHGATPGPNDKAIDISPFVPKVSHNSAWPAPLRLPNKDKPLPADPRLFAVGEDEDEDEGKELEYGNYDYGAYDSADNEEDEAEAADPGPSTQQRALTPSPKAQYNAGTVPAGLTTIPELAHLAGGRQLPHRRSLVHPAPKKKSKKAKKGPAPGRNADSESDASIVKKLNKAAGEIAIPNYEYFEYDGKFVPRVMTPPRGRRHQAPPTSPARTPSPVSSRAAVFDHVDRAGWRRSTASTAGGVVKPKKANRVSAIDIAIAAHDVPELLIPGPHDHHPHSRNENNNSSGGGDNNSAKAETYFVATRHDDKSPTGASARVRRSPSHEAVAMPPPARLDGVLVPCEPGCAHGEGGSGGSGRGAFFKERGLPSQEYVREECRSATAQTSPFLVSVSTPKRRYSCAVQSCYCRDDADDGKGKGKEKEKEKVEKCPSCRERDAIAQELNMTWV